MMYLMLTLTTMVCITTVEYYFFNGSPEYLIILGYLVKKLKCKMQDTS